MKPAQPTDVPTGLRLWWEAARPRTLPASIVPVLVGTAASDRGVTVLHDLHDAPGVHWERMALALVVALALQVAVNFANDWFDGVRGVDTVDRVGPRRVTASGLVTPAQIRAATFLALGVAAVAGLVLALATQPWLLLVGVAAGAATLGYSGGPRPYASAGLGELFVFVFFGLVATMGSQYVQDEASNLVGLVAGSAVGLWSVALLLVNNLRDIPTDTVAGKRTLAVRIGERATRRAYTACVLSAHLLVAALAALTGEAALALPALSLPVVVPAVRIVLGDPIGPTMIGALGRTARGQLVFGLLFVAGLLLRSPQGASALLERVG